MIQIKTYEFELKLRHTFTITHESRDVQPTLIVEITDGTYFGYGEATETPYYGVTMGKMKAQVAQVLPILQSWNTTEPPNIIWEKLAKEILDSHPFALCAIDCALWDFYAKKQGKKLYEIWGLSIEKNVITDYTIGMDTIPKMLEKMAEMPFPLYKIKLGTEHDIEIVEQLRANTKATFRVDANTAWSAEQTLAFAPRLKELGVEFIEQPLKANDWEGMKLLKGKVALPIMADESCILEEDVAQCAPYYDAVNIKLMKCGGLTPALRMIENAKNLGLKVMVGCMTESTIGCSAIAHLLPLLDYVDMDGPLLVHDHIATGITIDYGKIIYAQENGTGARLNSNL